MSNTKQYDNYADLITFTRASTGTYLDSDGLLKTATTNTPRIEYDADGNRKGLLIEEARTNALTRSIPISSVWTESEVLILEDNAVAPDGATTASKLVATATDSSDHRASLGMFGFATSGVSYTASAFVKAGEYNYAAIGMGAGAFAGEILALFDLSTGSLVVTDNATSSTVLATSSESYGNGWYRISVTSSASASNAAEIRLYPSNVNTLLTNSVGTSSFAGDGTSGIYVWGAQLEAGSFPTSYIITAGAAASRSADVASIPTSAFGYNADKGTLYVDGTFRNGETIVTLGSQTIAADANGDKDYAVSYSSAPSATSLVLNRGTYKTLNYYPRVLTAAQIAELTT